MNSAGSDCKIFKNYTPLDQRNTFNTDNYHNTFLKNKMIRLLYMVLTQRYNSKKRTLFKMFNSISRLFPETLLITTSIHFRILTSRAGLQLPDIGITTQGRTFPITWLTSVQQWQGSLVCMAELLKVISQGLVQNHNVGLFIALNCGRQE